MGAEHSRLNRVQVQNSNNTDTTTNVTTTDQTTYQKISFEYTSINIDIPVNLRLVHTFLSDAQKYLRSIRQVFTNVNEINTRKTLALLCINYAFQLLLLLNVDLQESDVSDCLEAHNILRDQLGQDLQVILPAITPRRAGDKVSSHEILLAEADSILSLADEQIKLGFKFDCIQNYHAAGIFYRVLMSMMPSLVPAVKDRLHYSVCKVRQHSTVHQNFVREHFDDVICGDVYEVHGAVKLGTGSYGSVYLASHRVTGDERAVKVMNVDKVTSYYLRKLHTEISILRSVDHPNIVKLQDVFFGRRSVYLVTDLCRGGELFELLNNGKSQGFVFREDRASRLMKDMISAVHYLHSRGIVHRDLKLENFLFESKTISSPLVLIDFGLSRFFDVDERLNHRVGSCYYTAPEVLTGTYDYRCDNWSLGVLCYMLLSGVPPFYGKTVDEVYAATLNQPLVFADKKFRHVSGCCIDFMKRFLTKDPERRMNTAEALDHPFISGVQNAMPQAVRGAGLFGMPSLSLSDNMHTVATSDSFDICNATVTPEAARNILNSLYIFSRVGPVIQLILTMVSFNLSPDQTCEVRTLFQTLDISRTGKLAARHLVEVLFSCEEISNRGLDLEKLLCAVKLDRGYDVSNINSNNNSLSYHEFVAVMLVHNKCHIGDEQIQVVYSALNPDGQGAVCDCDSLRLVLGENIPGTFLEHFVAAADLDGDHNVTVKDFMICWKTFQMNA